MSMELLASQARAVGRRDEANDAGVSMVKLVHAENPLGKAFLSLLLEQKFQVSGNALGHLTGIEWSLELLCSGLKLTS